MKTCEIRKIFVGLENQLHEIVCRETMNTDHWFRKSLTEQNLIPWFRKQQIRRCDQCIILGS